MRRRRIYNWEEEAKRHPTRMLNQLIKIMTPPPPRKGSVIKVADYIAVHPDRCTTRVAKSGTTMYIVRHPDDRVVEYPEKHLTSSKVLVED